MNSTTTEIPDTYMLRCPKTGEKIQVENSVGYKCCMDQLNYEIWEVNNFIQNTEIVYQLKKN